MRHGAGCTIKHSVISENAPNTYVSITSRRGHQRGRRLRDNAASSAILDRLLHRGHLLKFEGKSYRLKEAASRLNANRKIKDEKGKSIDIQPEN